MKLTVMFLPLLLLTNCIMNAKFWSAVFCDYFVRVTLKCHSQKLI